MRRIDVALSGRGYPIWIGSGAITQADKLLPYCGSEVLVVTNTTVAPLYLEKVLSNFQSIEQCHQLVLPDGEAYKNQETLNIIWDTLLEKQLSRRVVVVALGGGVIGDMVGFASACYQRGVAFLQIPTTLLAQVDASVGGKTAINHPLGKNMIGAFYQPKTVLIDVDTLTTLPQREYAAGLAEVLKYGLIWDAAFFDWLEANVELILAREQQVLIPLIERCCQIKAEIVAEDETEQGLRAILNFGHTLGHAIEQVSGYGVLLHGEAVAIGMIYALERSQQYALQDSTLLPRVQQWLRTVGLPTEAPEDCDPEALQWAMRQDKKRDGQQLNMILLTSLGTAHIQKVDYN